MFRNLWSCVAFVVLVGFAVAQPVAAAQSSGRASKPAAAAAAVVNINTASSSELQGLPGVGAKMAERIVDYRQKNGPFKKVEDLMNVQGIGEKNFLKLKPQITIGAPKADRASASN